MMAPAPSASRPRPVPREDTSPLWGSRGRVATRSGSRNRARERVQGRRGVGDRELNEGLADPWACHQMVLSQLDGLRQRRWAVALDPFGRRPQQPSDELFQDHQIDDCLDVANFGHQPLAAGVSELLGHHKGPTVIPQLHRAEALTMLFGGTADALKDGPLEIVVGQEACYQQLLCCHLCLPRQQRDQTHRPLGARPATRSAVFSKRSTNASGSSCGPIFISGTWAMEEAVMGLLRICRSSSCAWTSKRNRSSCSSLRSTSAWCCVW